MSSWWISGPAGAVRAAWSPRGLIDLMMFSINPAYDLEQGDELGIGTHGERMALFRGAASLLEADARLQQLKLEQAEILAHKASYQAQQREKHCIVQCALFVLARIALLRGERGQIAPLMHQMRGLIGRGNAASASMVDLCKAYLYGCLGSPEQMPRRARRCW